MSWLEDQVQTTDKEKTVDEKWLKFPDTPVGKTTEIRLRILDEEPIGTWRHWVGSRPFNCPGIERCPVCKVRMDAKKNNPESYRDEYRMDYRYYFNVYTEEGVKIWSFTSGVGRKLKVFLEKYGDLRDYDVSVRRRKTGPLPQNVEYDVIFEAKAPFTIEQSEAQRHDLTEFIQPANLDDLKVVATGEAPAKKVDAAEVPVVSGKATKADMIMLKALVEKGNYTLSDFGIVETDPPAKKIVDKLIEELKSER